MNCKQKGKQVIPFKNLSRERKWGGRRCQNWTIIEYKKILGNNVNNKLTPPETKTVSNIPSSLSLILANPLKGYYDSSNSFTNNNSFLNRNMKG